MPVDDDGGIACVRIGCEEIANVERGNDCEQEREAAHAFGGIGTCDRENAVHAIRAQNAVHAIRAPRTLTR